MTNDVALIRALAPVAAEAEEAARLDKRRSPGSPIRRRKSASPEAAAPEEAAPLPVAAARRPVSARSFRER